MPASAVPQAGQASNPANAESVGMPASCRNRAPVETGCRADYHLRMPGDAANTLQVVERAGPAGRVALRARSGERAELWVFGRYRGSELPATLRQARLVDRGGNRYRITADEGDFDFEADAVDRIAERAPLFSALHRPFALAAKERLAARALLALLRLPGGARLLRLWHAGRSA